MVAKIPYKDPEKQKRAMRKVMVKHRVKKKQEKKQAEKELLKLITENPEIEQQIPSTLDYIFGTRQRRDSREG